MKTTPLAAACIAATLASGATAHPHVFVDGGLGFVVDDQGRLTHLRVTWIFDAFYSLYALEDNQIDMDGDGVLTPEEEERLAWAYSQWIDGYEGDSYLWVDGQKQILSRPVRATATLLDDGRVRMTFLRDIYDTPDATGAAIQAKAYDPEYYTAYFLTEDVTLEGDGAADCSVRVDPVVIDDAKEAAREKLLEYDQYSTPDMPNVGELFADTAVLECAS